MTARQANNGLINAVKLVPAADGDSALSSGTSAVCSLLEAENLAAFSQTKTVPSIRGGGGGGG